MLDLLNAVNVDIVPRKKNTFVRMKKKCTVKKRRRRNMKSM